MGGFRVASTRIIKNVFQCACTHIADALASHGGYIVYIYIYVYSSGITSGLWQALLIVFGKLLAVYANRPSRFISVDLPYPKWKSGNSTAKGWQVWRRKKKKNKKQRNNFDTRRRETLILADTSFERKFQCGFSTITIFKAITKNSSSRKFDNQRTHVSFNSLEQILHSMEKMALQTILNF